MRLLLIILLLLCPTSLSADEFTTEAVQAAKAVYEADLKAAREKYSKELDEAAKKAVEAGDLEEVKRIVAAKESLEGKGSGTEKDGKPERVLWIKDQDKGFFERLHTGHWIERLSNDTADIHNESNRTPEYVELTLIGGNVSKTVRLYDTHLTVRVGTSNVHKRIIGGKWRE